MSEPRVLLYDLENAPSLAWVWQTRDIDQVVAVEADWFILSFAWKWLGEKRTHVLGLDDFDGYADDPEDDKALAVELHKLFDEADILIAHNGDQFDRRKANAKFLVHGLGPPAPYRTVDTLKVARKHFLFNSNRLGELGKQLGIGTKLDTGGFKTWRGCMLGDPASWATMKRYNKKDVDLLEKVYLKLLPWIDNHPNMATMAARPDACPKCGVRGRMILRNKPKFANVTASFNFQCTACRGYSRSRLTDREHPKPEYV